MSTGRLRPIRMLDEADQARRLTETPRSQLRRLIPLFALALAAGVLGGVLPVPKVARACECAPLTPIEALGPPVVVAPVDEPPAVTCDPCDQGTGTPSPEPTVDPGDPGTATPSPDPTVDPGDPGTATVTPVATPVDSPEPEPTRTPRFGPPRPQSYFPLVLDLDVVGSGSLERVRWVRMSEYYAGREIRTLEKSLVLVDDIAYIGLLDIDTDQAWIAMFNVSSPSAPVLIGESEPLFYHAEAWLGMPLALSGSTLYAAASTAGLHVADVSEPASPRWIGHLPLDGDAAGIAIDGHQAVLFEGLRSDIVDRGTNVNRMHVLDVSTPAAARVLGSTSNMMDTFVYRIAFADGFAYAATEEQGLVTLDVRDPDTITMTDAAGPANMRDVLVHGENIFGIRGGVTRGKSYGFWSYDRSIPSKPAFIHRLLPYVGGGFAYPAGLATDGEWAYVVDDGGGDPSYAPPALYAIDVRDISSPRIVAIAHGPRGTESWFASGIAAQDGLVVVSEHDSIYLYRHHRR